MNGLVKIVLLIFFFSFIAGIIIKTLDFLGYTFEQYAPYVFWFFVVLILISVLPEKKSSVLSD